MQKFGLFALLAIVAKVTAQDTSYSNAFTSLAMGSCVDLNPVSTRLNNCIDLTEKIKRSCNPNDLSETDLEKCWCNQNFFSEIQGCENELLTCLNYDFRADADYIVSAWHVYCDGVPSITTVTTPPATTQSFKADEGDCQIYHTYCQSARQLLYACSSTIAPASLLDCFCQTEQVQMAWLCVASFNQTCLGIPANDVEQLAAWTDCGSSFVLSALNGYISTGVPSGSSMSSSPASNSPSPTTMVTNSGRITRAGESSTASPGGSSGTGTIATETQSTSAPTTTSAGWRVRCGLRNLSSVVLIGGVHFLVNNLFG
ncbi:hypothetical protein H072_6507 [Dactylellina haptotyla CBS 200.50]|uniref:Extracellular membrane protein CFEM domain-containing protein n=1 Tax=Dactylellina haptotyla (strain CBS 200.50) TaxID=1284197 RepID=S8BK15_DACHA|nr:hypothetical protein H072_6507 [Dactylellina haptotyla CBS 200.50]